MISPKALIVGVVGAGCITAAGVGGYLAVRSGAAAPYAAPLTSTTAEIRQDAPAPTGPPALAAEPAGKSTPSTTAAIARPERAAPVRNPVTSRRDPVPAPSAAVTAEPVTGDEPPAVEPPVVGPVEPPAPAASADAVPTPEVEDLTVHADAVVGIQVASTVSSETAKIEDRVTGKVTRDVTVDGRVAIPAGSTVHGAVTGVQRGGKFKEPARLTVRFTSIETPQGLRVPIQTESIVRVSEAPTTQAASKIGASAAIGAIIGGVFGGKKGAAIGTTAGAAGGTAVVMAGEAKEALLAAGSPLTLRLTAPVTVTIERER